MRQKYVAGFLVDQSRSIVALVRKARPEWQKGKLNGIGGHIEQGESSFDAMSWEFKEETGVRVEVWRQVLKLSGKGFVVFFFVSFTDMDTLNRLKGQEDEPIELHPVNKIGELDTIPNLRWIVPMCLDKDHLYGEVIERFPPQMEGKQ